MQIKNNTNNYRSQGFGLKFTTESYKNVPSSIFSIMKKLEKQESTNDLMVDVIQKKNKYFLSIKYNTILDKSKDKKIRINKYISYSPETARVVGSYFHNNYFGPMEKKIKGEKKLSRYFADIIFDSKKLLSEFDNFKRLIMYEKYLKASKNSMGQGSNGGGGIFIFM